MDEACDRAHQSPAPSTQDQHSITIELFPCRKWVPVRIDAFVGGDQIDNCLDSPAFGCACQQPRDLVLSLSRNHSGYCLLHRLGTQLPQGAKTIFFFGQQEAAHAGHLG